MPVYAKLSYRKGGKRILLKRFYRAILTLLGLLCGAGFSFIIVKLLEHIPSFDRYSSPVSIGVFIVSTISFGLIFYFIAPSMQRSLDRGSLCRSLSGERSDSCWALFLHF